MRLLPFDYSVRNLGRSPVRMAAIVLGSALVAALVISAGAFLRGMNRAFELGGGVKRASSEVRYRRTRRRCLRRACRD